MKAKRFTIVLELEDGKRLMEIAEQQGCLWNERPNATELIRKIARNEIKLHLPKT